MTPLDRHRHDRADAALTASRDLSTMTLDQLRARRMELLEAGCALQSTDDPDVDDSYAAQDREIDRQIELVDAEIQRRAG